VLKLKFQKLHTTVVNNVNAANVVDFLFQEGVVADEDMRKLQAQQDHRQQCRELLGLLHTSGRHQPFVQLHRAIRNEPDLQWLVDCIDEFSDQSVTDVLHEQRYFSDPTGKLLWSFKDT